MLYEALEEKTAAAAPPVSGRIKTLPPSQLIITSVARFGAARPREIGFAMDSPLEGRVRSEPVSEMGFLGRELRLDSKTFMDDVGSVRALFGAWIDQISLCVSRLLPLRCRFKSLELLPFMPTRV